MHYKKYGQTEKELSVIGFGGLRFSPDDREGIAAVRRALELGINYFDTAPNYCEGRSEYIIGEGLKGHTGKAYVSTKSMVAMDPKADNVLRRIDTSIKKLGVKKIDFFHLWNVTDWSTFEKAVRKGGTYDGAVKAKEMGLIDHIAFSSHATPEEIIRMIDTGLFEGVTISYNLINHPYRWKAVEAAARAGLGVATMNTLHGGLIPQAAEQLAFIKESPEDSVVSAALRFNISHPEVTVALSGMKTVKEVEENVRAVQTIGTPSPDMSARLKEKITANNNIFCTMCGYCLPCKKGINIPLYMNINDMYSSLGMEAMARHHYSISRMKDKFGTARASDCDECGLCESRCTQHLDIMQRMKNVSALDISDFQVKIMKIISKVGFLKESQNPVISRIRKMMGAEKGPGRKA